MDHRRKAQHSSRFIPVKIIKELISEVRHPFVEGVRWYRMRMFLSVTHFTVSALEENPISGTLLSSGLLWRTPQPCTLPWELRIKPTFRKVRHYIYYPSIDCTQWKEVSVTRLIHGRRGVAWGISYDGFRADSRCRGLSIVHHI
jgi:hypothetical protein